MAATTGTPPGAHVPTAVAAARLSVGRLTLHVPAMSEAEARLLAEQVGEALRDWPTAPAASGRIGRLDVQVTAPPPASTGAAMAGVNPGTLLASITEGRPRRCMKQCLSGEGADRG